MGADVVLTPHGPHNQKFTFSKDERLCSQKIISGLFQPGFFISAYPFRLNVLYTELPVKGVFAQVVFVVGKKRFKRAVDRNRIKRIMRELYRLNKHEIYKVLESKGKTAGLALFYTGAEILPYQTMEPAFAKLIKKFAHEVAV